MSKWDMRVDGDVIICKAGFSADSRSDELSHSLYNAKLILASLVAKFPGKMTIYLSNSKKDVNWRYALSDIYKGNRTLRCRNKGCEGTQVEPMQELQQSNSRFFKAFSCKKCGYSPIPDTKPVYYQELRQYLIAKHGALVVPWGEADDWLGVNPKPMTVVVSIDKDLLMLPAYHYRLTSEKLLEAKDPGQLWISEDRKKLLGVGFKWFCTQMLMGDSIDNIKKPQKGFGPVAIYELLNPAIKIQRMWEIVVAHYRASGLKDEDILLNGKLLWISRKEKQVFDLSIVDELIEEYDNAQTQQT